MEIGIKTLILLLLLSVVAITLVDSKRVVADPAEQIDTEGIFLLFWVLCNNIILLEIFLMFWVICNYSTM